jgi:hypothetical protein
MPAFFVWAAFVFAPFVFAPGAVAIEAKRRLDFLSLEANRRARITCGQAFRWKML